MFAQVAMPGGRLDNPLDPAFLPEPSVIVETLANVCRWGGRCRPFYSVLQHCVTVASILPQHLKIQGLLHDFQEAWIGDIPAPLKALPEYAFINAAEEKLQRRVWEKYGGFAELDPLVQEMDSRMASTEAAALGLGGEWLKAAAPPLDIAVSPVGPARSVAMFWEFLEQNNIKLGARQSSGLSMRV